MTNSSSSLKRRKGQAKDQLKSKKSEPQVVKSDVQADEIRESRFSEPLPTFPKQRVWTRIVVVLGTLIVVYFTSSQDKIVNLAKVKDSVNNRKQDVKCSQAYLDEVSEFKGCIPSSCGRVVMDHVVTTEEADLLLDLAKRGLSLGGGSGGASILDLHSGALSKGDVFVDLYSSFNVSELFTLEDFALYIRVRRKIQEAVAMNFKLQPDKLYLTKPTFFSRLTAAKAVTPHDEYWHPHVDKDTYKSFHYTSLVYLTNYGSDFKGGRFIFDDPDNVSTIVEPKKGRVSAFTSGKENLHRVEKVEQGTRFAITVSFTCEKKYSIADPSLKPKRKKQ